jgi:hypothetical protein
VCFSHVTHKGQGSGLYEYLLLFWQDQEKHSATPISLQCRAGACFLMQGILPNAVVAVFFSLGATKWNSPQISLCRGRGSVQRGLPRCSAPVDRRQLTQGFLGTDVRSVRGGISGRSLVAVANSTSLCKFSAVKIPFRTPQTEAGRCYTVLSYRTKPEMEEIVFDRQLLL